jgi:hypothetical protein
MKNHINNCKNYFCTKLVILAVIGSLTFSGISKTTAHAAEIPYDAAEVIKIKAFLAKQSMVEGKTNADLLGITDLNEPGTWTGVGWIDKHPNSTILEPIMLENKHVQYIQWPQSLGSSLEISGFTYLQMFQLNHSGGSYGDRSKYSDISIHDNPRLESIRIVYASVGIIRITQNPILYGVSLELVDARELAIESPVLKTLGSTTMGSGTLNFAAYPLLEKLQLRDCNNVTFLDLSGCPNIDVLDASGLKKMEAIKFGSKHDLNATISGNPVLTSIDFRSLHLKSVNCSVNASLVSFLIDKNSPLTKAEINGNNALTKLDLSNQPYLEELNCEGNSCLKELLLKGNTKLGYIYCNNCALTSLDVSGLTSLKILEVSGNQLTGFSASGVQFTKLALLNNKLKKISANVTGFNINVKSYKEYGYVSFNTGKDIQNPDDPNTYFYIQYDGLKDPNPHTYFREITGSGLPEGKNAWKSSFPLKSDIDVTLYFDGYVHFVSWFESATGDPYDEKAVLSLKLLAGDLIGPTPPDTASRFPADCPPPIKKGHVLQGWYTDMALTQPWNLLKDTLTPGLVLFPYWIPESYPTVVSIKRKTPTSENAETDHVTYNVTFSKTVSGIDISDFKLTSEGTVTGKIALVSAANGNTISVEVNSISGTGTLRLDVKSTETGIVDADSNPLAGGFTSGEMYSFGTATAIEDNIESEMSCKIFPNPTTGRIEFKTLGNELLNRIEIFNIQGKPVLSIYYPLDNHLDLTGFPDGIYLVLLQTESGIHNQKIVKSGLN